MLNENLRGVLVFSCAGQSRETGWKSLERKDKFAGAVYAPGFVILKKKSIL
jgi:hypothetical protein